MASHGGRRTSGHRGPHPSSPHDRAAPRGAAQLGSLRCGWSRSWLRMAAAGLPSTVAPRPSSPHDRAAPHGAAQLGSLRCGWSRSWLRLPVPVRTGRAGGLRPGPGITALRIRPPHQQADLPAYGRADGRAGGRPRDAHRRCRQAEGGKETGDVVVAGGSRDQCGRFARPLAHHLSRTHPWPAARRPAGSRGRRRPWPGRDRRGGGRGAGIAPRKSHICAGRRRIGDGATTAAQPIARPTAAVEGRRVAGCAPGRRG